MSHTSGKDYLTALFSRDDSDSPPVPSAEPDKKALAITADNIPDILAKINLSFLTPYFLQEPSRLFDFKTASFFYSYNWPELLSETKDNDCESEADFEGEDDMDVSETLYLGVITPGQLKAGICITYNEDRLY